MLPETMTISIPTARIPVTDICSIRFDRLRGVRKIAVGLPSERKARSEPARRSCVGAQRRRFDLETSFFLLFRLILTLILIPCRRRHYFFRRRFASRKFAGQFAFVQNQNAVGKPKNFGQFRRNQHDRQPFFGELVDLRVDFLFCADIDAARRLVEKQNFRIRQKPFSEHDFLLIAARKRSGDGQRRICLDAQATSSRRLPRRFRACGSSRNAPEIRFKPGERHIVENRLFENQTETLAVFGHKPDAVLDRIRRRVDRNLLAFDQDLAAKYLPCHAPKIVIKSSLRPAPIRPAMPRTSPFLTLKRNIVDQFFVRHIGSNKRSDF